MSKNIVELHGVSKSYHLGGTLVTALDGLSLHLAAGEFTALVGASGSGKSTLLNIIGCIDIADSGQVYIDGDDVAKMSERQRSHLRNRKIGFVFQSFNLVPVLTACENVEVPLLLDKSLSGRQRRELAMAALKDVQMDHLGKNLPDQLSGGQRQRVAIARALVSGSQLVLADEPTANLDSHTTTLVLDMLMELNAKKVVTFLFCTHDEKLIRRANKILRIQDGKILDAG